jgi:hypothetical protein
MQKYAIDIDPGLLRAVIKIVLEQLPGEYLKAYAKLEQDHLRAGYTRDSQISKHIKLPANTDIVFKRLEQQVRITNILYKTSGKPIAELSLVLNAHGIIGLNIGDDLEDILPDTIDASKFIVEVVPVSPFHTGFTDLEYIKVFDPIGDYLDPKSTSEVFTVAEKEYCSIVNLSDKKSIVIDDNNSVFSLNKRSGQVKLLFKRPGDFIHAVNSGTLTWLES